ncbi:hypothetical protein NM897_15400 [Planococcus maritimus]|uniref:hypothetical protein n=1 Tax=Planococcus maritimus TaxID=192421 RepID=UPI00313997E8
MVWRHIRITRDRLVVFFMIKNSEMPTVLTESFFHDPVGLGKLLAQSQSGENTHENLHEHCLVVLRQESTALDKALDSIVIPDSREVVKIGSHGTDVKYAHIVLKPSVSKSAEKPKEEEMAMKAIIINSEADMSAVSKLHIRT